MKRSLALAFLLAFAASATAQSRSDHEAHHAPSAGATESAPFAEGEVRRIDKDAKKITIKHGPLEALDMPPMTMVFQVADPAMLEQVKPGDKIRFQAEKKGGSFTVTKLQPAS